eukprot:TRINITY_DN8657_c0_g6_i1.p1 TRINITY_DN8657_c0_g6~~TRINITY_DN8657_c0_g6_i1.p1  ORF type:complete len:245 (-),score=58.35 TRINITY_DN8657_c0_g6_i1:189-923(-)
MLPDVLALNVDITKLPELAEELMVKSVPTTFIVYKQSVVDVLVGVPSDEKFKEFCKAAEILYNLEKPELELEESIKSNVTKIEKGDVKDGIASLQGILVKKNDLLDRHKARIHALIADAYYKLGDTKSSEDHLSKAQEHSKTEPPDKTTSQLISNLSKTLTEHKDQSIEFISGDHRELYEKAVRLLKAGKSEECVELCLGIIRGDRNWEQGKAKELVIEAISGNGVSKEFAKSTRRKLAAILFG